MCTTTVYNCKSTHLNPRLYMHCISLHRDITGPCSGSCLYTQHACALAHQIDKWQLSPVCIIRPLYAFHYHYQADINYSVFIRNWFWERDRNPIPASHIQRLLLCGNCKHFSRLGKFANRCLWAVGPGAGAGFGRRQSPLNRRRSWGQLQELQALDRQATWIYRWYMDI